MEGEHKTRRGHLYAPCWSVCNQDQPLFYELIKMVYRLALFPGSLLKNGGEEKAWGQG